MALPHAPTISTNAGPALNRRLDDIGWAAFLILTGVLWLFPESQVPPGTWLIGTGFLLLGLNAVRAMKNVPISGVTTLLGALALVAGLTARWGLHLPIVAIGLVLLGLGLLARPLIQRT